MKFDRVNLTQMKLNADSPIKESYVTSVQNNAARKVTITRSECKASVKALSRKSTKAKK